MIVVLFQQKTDLYGLPNAQHGPYRISSDLLENDSIDSKLIEFPLLVTKFLGKKIPAAGGFLSKKHYR